MAKFLELLERAGATTWRGAGAAWRGCRPPAGLQAGLKAGLDPVLVAGAVSQVVLVRI